MTDKKILIIAYVFYWAIVMFFTFGCPMYAVFMLGFNPWWMMLAIASGFGFPPHRWYCLMDGVNRPTMATKGTAK